MSWKGGKKKGRKWKGGAFGVYSECILIIPLSPALSLTHSLLVHVFFFPSYLLEVRDLLFGGLLSL